MHKLNVVITAIALTLVIIAIASHNQAPVMDTPDTEEEETSALHEKVESPNPEPIPDAVEREEEKHEEVPFNPEVEKEPTEPVKEEPIEPVKEEDEEKINSELSKELIMIHNGQGSMCVNQLKFLEELKPQYPSLAIVEYLTTEQGTRDILNELKAEYTASEGISKTFGYLPITFVNNHAYSGFNSEVKEKLLKDIEDVTSG